MRLLLPPVLLLAAACHAQTPPRANLGPRATPPLVAVRAADSEEAALLFETLRAEPARAEGLRFYFGAELAGRLRDAGFEPEPADAARVLRRVVRAYGPGESGLRGAGVRILTRERGYWVVDGAIVQLRSLAAAGYRLTRPGPDEPFPRQVRVRVPAQADVQRVSDLGVDVYGAMPDGGRWVLTGSAFEWQIEQMTAAGYAVERSSTVPPRAR